MLLSISLHYFPIYLFFSLSFQNCRKPRIDTPTPPHPTPHLDTNGSCPLTKGFHDVDSRAALESCGYDADLAREMLNRRMQQQDGDVKDCIPSRYGFCNCDLSLSLSLPHTHSLSPHYSPPPPPLGFPCQIGLHDVLLNRYS